MRNDAVLNLKFNNKPRVIRNDMIMEKLIRSYFIPNVLAINKNRVKNPIPNKYPKAIFSNATNFGYKKLINK